MGSQASSHVEQLWKDLPPHYYQDADHAWSKLRAKQVVQILHPMDPATPKPEGHLRVVCISDTHGLVHEEFAKTVPPGDILIHAGDFSNVGAPADIEAFNKFLGLLPHKHKVVIAGNHDITFDRENYDELKKQFHRDPYFKPDEVRALLTNCTYLEDSECVVEGLRIYGSPWQPEFFNWAFNLPRGDPLQKVWEKIPAGVDILITHGPPVGHGDLTRGQQRAGCVNLLKEIQTRIKPKYHVFGHIHEAYGMTTDGQTTYVNPSTCTLRYKPTNPPIVFDIQVGAMGGEEAKDAGKEAKEEQ